MKAEKTEVVETDASFDLSLIWPWSCWLYPYVVAERVWRRRPAPSWRHKALQETPRKRRRPRPWPKVNSLAWTRHGWTLHQGKLRNEAGKGTLKIRSQSHARARAPGLLLLSPSSLLPFSFFSSVRTADLFCFRLCWLLASRTLIFRGVLCSCRSLPCAAWVTPKWIWSKPPRRWCSRSPDYSVHTWASSGRETNKQHQRQQKSEGQVERIRHTKCKTRRHTHIHFNCNNTIQYLHFWKSSFFLIKKTNKQTTV